MENILLIVHLIIAIFLIAVVLLQRSEGGALGMGGGGGVEAPQASQGMAMNTASQAPRSNPYGNMGSMFNKNVNSPQMYS